MSFIKVADKVREAFKELEARSGDGSVTPQDLVEYAKPKSSPLHDQFEWNDKKAGQEYRIWQARQLLRRITIDVEDKTVREYQNIAVEVGNQGYYHISTVMSDKDLKGKVMRQMLKDLEGMERRYQKYEELFEMINVKKIRQYREQYLQV